MFLKEVHMENFKSFGRKLTVPFQPGYSAITGPNGSGKSNIGDAIMFVLGPNSPRAIRAGRLTDLIFNGGSAGKAAGYTLVSLTFDNKDRKMPIDADDVVLTRKVKRAPKKGDKDGYNSYFYLNGRAAKKREFVDLLKHAHIAADGYNITAQGDVLQICQMSNMQRRGILDDIAGVTAFDKDIDQANKRKGEVEENLERIGIVLDEIAGSLKRLEREKDSAQKYKDLKATLTQTKGLMAWRRRTDLEAQIAQVQRQIEQQMEARTKAEEKLAELRATYDETQKQFAELEQTIREEGGEEVEKLQDDIKAARDRMVRLEEKITFAKDSLKDDADEELPLKEELRKLTKEANNTKKIVDQCAGDFETASKDLTTRKKELETVQDAISKGTSGAMELNKELGKLKAEHEKAQLALHEAQLEGQRLQDKQDAAVRIRDERASDLETLKQDVEEAAWELGEAQKASGGSDKERKNLDRRRFDLMKAQSEFSQQNEDLESRIRRLSREHADLQAQLDAAARASGGVGRAVETLMAARERGDIRGIVGTIADLASVDDKYQVALQTAAGNNLHAIVVEDDAVAAECIELLKRTKSGRAKLLPLNKVVPGRPRGQALMKVKKDGCLGFCLDVVDFNERYHGAFWQVFGDTLVATNMNVGRSLMGGVRIVTLDGELFEAGGAMVGGAKGGKKAESGFANNDRSQLDKLIGQIAEAEGAQEQALEGLSRVRKELETVDAELAKYGHADAGAADRAKELQVRHARLTEKAQKLSDDLEHAEKAILGFQEDLEANDQRVMAINEQLAGLEATREEKSQLLLRGSRKDLREKAESLTKEIQELTESVTKLEGRRDVAAKQLELIQGRIKEVEDQLGGRDEARAKHRKDIDDRTAELKKAKAEVDALMAMERKATASLSGLRDKKDAAYKMLVDIKAKMDTQSSRIETHYGLITNNKAKLPAMEENLGEAMLEMEEHPVEIEDEHAVPSFDDLRRTLRNTEASIDRLGAVNMRALEEFEEQSKRQEDLTTETDRLREQREQLVLLVEGISEKKKAALMVVFDAVNENFAHVYERLSMGGKAYMKLENPDNPFEAGLTLMAQPMGKRVTRLDSLSGGEKSLTSMAFIFALQLHEPSPFYYLDEVDQNLDAVNSELLAKLIKDNARFAQFIQVSLRKITLKEADTIYGVTQTTPGQSEVIADFDLKNVRDEDKPSKPAKPGDETPAATQPSDDDDDTSGETLSDAIEGMVTVQVQQ